MMKIITLLFLSAWLSGCGGGATGTNSTVTTHTVSAPTTMKGSIEQSLGVNLQYPVFQCGTATDTITADVAPESVALFEGGPVRPITLSSDGKWLYVTNAPAQCLEIYSVEGDTLRLASAVSVGLEPVSVAERNTNEVWVVNHLSDSISIVRLDGTPRVLRTLLVGDEPRDIVFAGVTRERAFVSAASRGQNKPGFTSALLTTPATGRADIWVFDASQLDESLSGKPVVILTLPADLPRALAVSADGRSVYAATFISGNRTTALHRDALSGASKTGVTTSIDRFNAPDTGLIVRYDGAAWRDETGRDWSSKVKFTLPDEDIFIIDAVATTPMLSTSVSGVGTTLFNMAVSPADGRLYVSNTESFNEVRFEGAGVRGTTVRGRIAESRVTVVNPSSGSLVPVHLNSHVNFTLVQGASVASAEKARTLAQPMGLVFSPQGDTIYLAAFGSSKIAVLQTSSITPTAFVPDSARHIAVPAGPAGLALNALGTRLYVYSRIAHAVSVINTQSRTLLSSRTLFSPESTQVRDGRQFLYDANLSSANGTVSCASCHIFGDMDHLAWDLGNPDDGTIINTNTYVGNSPKTTFRFHPLKGPMSTQTLRGMRGNGPLHWRGDRIGANRQVVRGTTESLEEAAFKEFNSAFISLMGKEAVLSAAQLQAFTDFTMQLMMPPNPVRALDNSLTQEQEAGKNTYLNTSTTLLGSCDNCHRLRIPEGKFGTGGTMSFEGGRISENFKVPQLRNVYQKVGMFGFSADSGGTTGAQIRGFGFSNDGAIDTLETFFKDPVFLFPEPVARTRQEVISFVLAFDTDFAPIVGQQLTWRPGANESTETRLNLLKAQAQVTTPRPACDLVARGTFDGLAMSALLQTDGNWLMRGGGTKTEAALRQLATVSQPITFTCLPPRTGRRVALDRI